MKRDPIEKYNLLMDAKIAEMEEYALSMVQLFVPDMTDNQKGLVRSAAAIAFTKGVMFATFHKPEPEWRYFESDES